MPNEFDIIATYFAPLASQNKASLGLLDDAAILDIPAESSLVITKDAITEGTHFFATDPVELLGRKLLRTNLSDLAAMGASPLGYLLALILPSTTPPDWFLQFTKGLKEDQDLFQIPLLGGDTVSHQGPLTLSITALGLVPKSKAITRSLAKPGDAIMVSGTIGDSMLGLMLLQKHLEITALLDKERDFLISRYHLPQPRTMLGQYLCGVASSAIDISDGLIQDLKHILSNSSIGAEINLDLIPYSEPAKSLISTNPSLSSRMITGGDDYELCFTIDETKLMLLQERLKHEETPITRIGTITTNKELKLFSHGKRVDTPVMNGYQHFRPT